MHFLQTTLKLDHLSNTTFALIWWIDLAISASSKQLKRNQSSRNVFVMSNRVQVFADNTQALSKQLNTLLPKFVVFVDLQDILANATTRIIMFTFTFILGTPTQCLKQVYSFINYIKYKFIKIICN